MKSLHHGVSIEKTDGSSLNTRELKNRRVRMNGKEDWIKRVFIWLAAILIITIALGIGELL